jgi:crossover junction endodeoxyribonuclease RuvC
MFAFGKAYGVILGVLAARHIPMTLVPPVRWKRALGVSRDKDAGRARASQLLPAAGDQWPLKRHTDPAEACLLALYGLRQLVSTDHEGPGRAPAWRRTKAALRGGPLWSSGEPHPI